MKRLFSVLPWVGAAAALSLAALASSAALAQSCQLDNGGGCLREGMRCSPPANGKCKTVLVGTREFRCECQSSSRPAPNRSDRPRASHPDTEPDEPPQEEQEPREPHG